MNDEKPCDKSLQDALNLVHKFDEEHWKMLAKCEVVIQDGMAYFVNKEDRAMAWMPEEDYNGILEHNETVKEDKE